MMMFKNLSKNQKMMLIAFVVFLLFMVWYMYNNNQQKEQETFCGEKMERFGCPSCMHP